MALQALVENRQSIGPLELIIGNDDIEAPLGKSRLKILAAEDLDTVDGVKAPAQMAPEQVAIRRIIIDQQYSLHFHLPPWCWLDPENTPGSRHRGHPIAHPWLDRFCAR
jgi:hypothetical protein